MYNLPNVWSRSNGEAILVEEEGETMIISTSMSAEKERMELFVEYGLEVLFD